jgi:hypothetical protein
MMENKSVLRGISVPLSVPKSTLILFFVASLCLTLSLAHLNVQAQSLPVGTPVMEDYYRRTQLMGNADSTASFMIRPLFPFSIDTTENFYSDSLFRPGLRILDTQSRKKSLQVLPAILRQQYYGNPYYNLNNSSIIKAKGYQTQLSAGIFAEYGPLSIKLNPDFVFATNDKFTEYRTHYGFADIPVRFNGNAISRVNWGQSSVRLSFDPVSIGLSNENIWWGPGVRNALIMSNSAPGFKHLTLNTTRPVHTKIGSIEAQIIAGRLENSGNNAALPDDWRYLSGLAFSYQPRWIPGFFMGFTRSFQIYHEDMDDKFSDYFPLFQAFQKVNTKEETKRRDQLLSVFARWLLSESKAEVYFEYGFADHSYNFRDFLMTPEHSRAYTLGLRKIVPYRSWMNEFIQIGIELSHFEQPIDRAIRNSGEWYTHSEVLAGYTHKGEVLGAGIGPGGNFQTVNVSWVKGLKQLGIQLERYEHNGDLANAFGYREWVDFSTAVFADWTYKEFIMSTKLQGIKSVNYQWQSRLGGAPKKNPFNLNIELGLMYRF